MDFWTARSERITAIFSTVMAVAILAGGVTAFQSHHASVDDVVQLESDLRFQLEMGFRHDPNERTRRLEQLEKVSQTWQQSPRTQADHVALADWLLEATIRSMPGSIEALPIIPRFGEPSQLPAGEPSADILVEPSVVEEHIEYAHEFPAPVALVPTPVALPMPFVATETSSTSTELLSVPQPEAVVSQVVETPVRINLTELAARIAGYHEGLNEIETALLSLDAGDFTALAKQIGQLEEITSDFQFTKLYYEALTDKERRSVAEPRPMTSAIAVVERRIDQTQAALSSDYLGEFDASNQDRIGALRQQLAELTATTR